MSQLAQRLRAALTRPSAEPPLEGDYPELRGHASKEAAVLIAVTDRDEPGVLLTVRREHLRTHAGQISFRPLFYLASWFWVFLRTELSMVGSVTKTFP